MRSLALAALLLVACSDDPVGRGNLPAHAGFRITVDSVSEERCREFGAALTSIALGMLDGATPQIFVPEIGDPCSWVSDEVLQCHSFGEFTFDFAAMAVSRTVEIDDDPATPACVVSYSMGEIIDLDAQ